MHIAQLLQKVRAIWPEKMPLADIIPATGKVFGDICTWQRNAPKDRAAHTDAELKKELGNMIFSTIRWCDDLGHDPEECIALAQEAQRRFVEKESPAHMHD